MTETIKVPMFEMYRLGDTNRHNPVSFPGGEVGTEIENVGKLEKLVEFQLRSGILADMITFLEIGTMHEMGMTDGLRKLPPEAIEAGRNFHRLCKGLPDLHSIATNDFCYPNPDDPVWMNGFVHRDYKQKFRYDGYRDNYFVHEPFTWVSRPLGYQENGNQLIYGADTDVRKVYLPKEGYIKQTPEGRFCTKTGAPYATASMKDATESLEKAGMSPDIAENEMLDFLGRRDYNHFAAYPTGVCISAGIKGYRHDSLRFRFINIGRPPTAPSLRDGTGSFYISRSPLGGT